MSSKAQLCLANLGLLDRGAAQLIVDRALATAVGDTDDRGDDCKPRKVVITVIVQKAKTGAMDIQLECAVSLPVLRVNPTLANCRLDHQGRQHVLDFQPMTPSNPDQEELEFDKDKGADS